MVRPWGTTCCTPPRQSGPPVLRPVCRSKNFFQISPSEAVTASSIHPNLRIANVAATWKVEPRSAARCHMSRLWFTSNSKPIDGCLKSSALSPCVAQGFLKAFVLTALLCQKHLCLCTPCYILLTEAFLLLAHAKTRLHLLAGAADLRLHDSSWLPGCTSLASTENLPQAPLKQLEDTVGQPEHHQNRNRTHHCCHNQQHPIFWLPRNQAQALGSIDLREHKQHGQHRLDVAHLGPGTCEVLQGLAERPLLVRCLLVRLAVGITSGHKRAHCKQKLSDAWATSAGLRAPAIGPTVSSERFT